MAIQFRLRGLDLRIIGMQNRLQFLHPKVGALPFFPDPTKGFPSDARLSPYTKAAATLRERYRRCAWMKARIIEPNNR